MSIQAYQQAAVRVEDPRDTEYRAFALATHQLVEAERKRRVDIGELAAALDKNRRLWTLLGEDCALPTNRLPHALRAQVISLSLFVERYTREVLREGADVAPLIEINRSMMEGLAGR